MVLSLVFVRSYNFGWSPVYDCKAYLKTNTVKSCSYFGFQNSLVGRAKSAIEGYGYSGNS